MTAAQVGAPVREASWYGWVLAFAFVLAPIAGWVGPLAFAPIVGLTGLLLWLTSEASKQQQNPEFAE